MGMASEIFCRILRLCEQGHLPARPRIADIGAQQLGNSFRRDQALLRRAAGAFGVPWRQLWPPPPEPPAGVLDVLPPNAPYAGELWEWLGCDYVAIDIDGSPHAIPLDLNYDDAPEEFRGRFDLVMNLGTTEHVANQLQAMKVIHDLTKVGGVMIHNVPAQGFATHGLVNYNPKFFWMLARSNEYHWLGFDLSFTDAQPLPTDIIDELRRIGAATADHAAAQRIPDAGIVVVLKKTDATAYLPPMDVPNGGKTKDEGLLRRYPGLFVRA